ncbi:MAG TPA: signal peptidase I [Candidatus Saccharimonadales bacterium]|nr:signal peptidase I [Candidatus Saccharimonadales bacterium]
MAGRYIKRALIGLSLLLAVGAATALVAVEIRGGKLLSVQTGSMTPAIRKGSLVVVTRVPASSLKVGDVVTYISPLNNKETITHRIVRLPNQDSKQFVVKGDANKIADPPVAPGSIVGKVGWHVSDLGYALDFIRTPLGLILLIYLPALLVVFDEIRRLSDYYRQTQPYYSPEFEKRLHRQKSKYLLVGKVMAVIAVASLLFAWPSYALLQDTTTLSGNTIKSSVKSPTKPSVDQEVVHHKPTPPPKKHLNNFHRSTEHN